MKRISLIFCCALLSCAFAEAKTTQRITMKNGSVYQGYISRQTGNGTFEVVTDQAMVVLDNRWVASQQTAPVAGQQLDSVWFKWAEGNDAFQNDALVCARRLGVCNRDRADKRARVRMHRMEDDFVAFCHFDHVPQVHNADSA